MYLFINNVRLFYFFLFFPHSLRLQTTFYYISCPCKDIFLSDCILFNWEPPPFTLQKRLTTWRLRGWLTLRIINIKRKNMDKNSCLVQNVEIIVQTTAYSETSKFHSNIYFYVQSSKGWCGNNYRKKKKNERIFSFLNIKLFKYGRERNENSRQNRFTIRVKKERDCSSWFSTFWRQYFYRSLVFTFSLREEPTLVWFDIRKRKKKLGFSLPSITWSRRACAVIVVSVTIVGVPLSHMLKASLCDLHFV